jgi:hypothetical protein
MISRAITNFSCVAAVVLGGCTTDPVTAPPAFAGTAGTVATPAGGSGGAGTGGAGGRSGAGSAAGGAGGAAAGAGGRMGAGGTYAEENPSYVCADVHAEFGSPPSPMEGGGGSGGAAAGGAGGRGAGGAGGSMASAGASGGAGSTANAGSGGASGAVREGTFSDLHKLLQCRGCSSSFCHGGAAELSFQISKSEIYDELVGAGTGNAASSISVCSGMQRVVPGQPDMSVLYQKLADMPSCGTAMPPPGQGQATDALFNARELEVVRSWIMAGAKKN